jgi:hypothetical protein
MYVIVIQQMKPNNEAARAFPSALATARTMVRTLVVLNLGLGVAIVALLVAGFVARDAVFAALGANITNGRLIAGMRLVAVVGIASTPLTHILLTRLLAIIDTVRDGDPFVAGNAARLQTTAWALLGLELLHLAVGAIAATVSSASEPLDLNWNFSIAGWLAVLLLFVLARVFDHGTRMRDDLEGTV